MYNNTYLDHIIPLNEHDDFMKITNKVNDLIEKIKKQYRIPKYIKTK